MDKASRVKACRLTENLFMRRGGFIPEKAGAVGADADRGEGHDGEGRALLVPSDWDWNLLLT